MITAVLAVLAIHGVQPAGPELHQFDRWLEPFDGKPVAEILEAMKVFPVRHDTEIGEILTWYFANGRSECTIAGGCDNSHPRKEQCRLYVSVTADGHVSGSRVEGNYLACKQLLLRLRR